MRLSKEERTARRVSFRKLSPADKVSYIYSYYKLPIVVGLIVLYLLCSAAYRQLTKKEVLVYPALINISVGDNLETVLGDGFVTAAGANPRKAEVY